MTESLVFRRMNTELTSLSHKELRKTILPFAESFSVDEGGRETPLTMHGETHWSWAHIKVQSESIIPSNLSKIHRAKISKVTIRFLPI